MQLVSLPASAATRQPGKYQLEGTVAPEGDHRLCKTQYDVFKEGDLLEVVSLKSSDHLPHAPGIQPVEC